MQPNSHLVLPAFWIHFAETDTVVCVDLVFWKGLKNFFWRLFSATVDTLQDPLLCCLNILASVQYQVLVLFLKYFPAETIFSQRVWVVEFSACEKECIQFL